jgi:MFS family permease
VDEVALSARRITRTLFLAQSLGSAGYIGAVAVNALVGADLSHSPSLAGAPSAVSLLGGALAAFVWGYLMEVLGRRLGLVLGLALAAVGNAVAGWAVVTDSFSLFLLGLLLVGVGYAALLLGRFAAGEVHRPAERGRAIATVVLGGTVGAILGPLLVGPTGQLAQQMGLGPLIGPYGAGLILFILAAATVLVGLRPDPRDLGRALTSAYQDGNATADEARPLGEIVRAPGFLVAMGSMAFAQAVMTMLMAITSLHMQGHHHSLGDISLVISAHTVGMFAFSVFSGRLADRWGRGPVILTGGTVLILACLLAPWSNELLPLSLSLFLLGLGWNFAYVGGSSLLSDQLSASERGKAQGFNDLTLGLASTAGSFGSGVVFAATGFAVMALVGAAAAVVPFSLAVWWQLRRRRFAPT